MSTTWVRLEYGYNIITSSYESNSRRQLVFTFEAQDIFVMSYEEQNLTAVGWQQDLKIEGNFFNQTPALHTTEHP